MSLTIKLAGQPYDIEAFTVGQLADLHISANEPQLDINTKDGARAFWVRNIGVLSCALGKPREEIEQMRLGTFKQVSDAVTDILVYSGIWARTKAAEADPPGEAQAAA
jgi:hypothetical protein